MMFFLTINVYHKNLIFALEPLDDLVAPVPRLTVPLPEYRLGFSVLVFGRVL